MEYKEHTNDREDVNSEAMYMKSNTSMNLPFVAANSQWRVDLLQKIEVYFFRIYRDSVDSESNLGGNHGKIESLQMLCELLVKAQMFLGPTLRWMVFRHLVEKVHDSSEEVRRMANTCVNELLGYQNYRNTTYVNDTYDSNNNNNSKSGSSGYDDFKFKDELIERLMTQVREGIDAVSQQAHISHKKLSNESDMSLRSMIYTLIGSIQVIGSSAARNVLSISSENSSTRGVFFKLSRLVVPSVAGTSSIVLTNKEYIHLGCTDNKARSIEAGYYRSAHLCTDSVDIKKAIRELFFSVGRHGDVLALYECSTFSLRRLKRALWERKRGWNDVNSNALMHAEEKKLDQEGFKRKRKRKCLLW